MSSHGVTDGTLDVDGAPEETTDTDGIVEGTLDAKHSMQFIKQPCT